MTSFMRDSFIFIAESASLIWLLKITLILAVSLLILKFGRSARASLRHLLLTCTFAVILLLPAATLVSPPLRVEVPDSKVHSTELAPANQGLVATAFEQNARTNTTARSPFSYKFSVPQILWLVWSLGAGLVLFKLVVSLCRLRAVRRSAMPSLEINQALQQLANDAAVRRRIEVLLHDAVDVPLTYGLFRPVILLPIDAWTWNETELRHVFVHELEHIKRFDWSVQVMSRMACGIYWFQPLVWMAWRQLCLEAERSCDDAVLVRSDRADYAEHLLSLARRLSNRLAPPVLSMANRTRRRTFVDCEVVGITRS